MKTSNTDFITGLEEKDAQDEGNFYRGNRLRFFVVKSRIAKPAFQATVYLDFDKGYNKWDGLIEDAVRYGFINEVRGGFQVPSYSDKKITHKELITNDEICKTFIEDFNKKSIERMSYSNATS